jgi:hypothetical protein
MTAWRKSSFCANRECVEALPQGGAWKAPWCMSGECVEALPDGTSFTRATASYANGNCVVAGHAGGEFTRAAGSNLNGNCVEAQGGPTVLVRDSKDPDGPHLHFTPEEWEVMLAVTQQGERVFTEVNLRAKEGQRTFALTADGDDDVLYFTLAEVEAWEDGVRNGEFDLVRS